MGDLDSLDLAAIVRESADQIFLIDARSARFLFANDHALEANGYTLEEFLTMTPLDLQAGVTLPQLTERIALLHTGEQEVVAFAATYQRKDRSTYEVEHRVQLLTAHDPPVFLVLAREFAGVSSDNGSADRPMDLYRKIVEETDDGVWIIDAQNMTTYVNDAIARMLGYAREEMMGALVFDFMDDEGRAIATANLERRRTGLRQQLEFKYIRKDGTELWAIIAVHALLDESGGYAGAQAIVTDITERKLQERNLLKSLHLASEGDVTAASGGAEADLAVWMPSVAGLRSTLVAKRFSLLADPRRLELIELLASGNERSVNELAIALHMSQSNVSKHLKVLVEAGLLHRRQEGTKAFYALADPTVAILCRIVCQWLGNQAQAEYQALAS